MLATTISSMPSLIVWIAAIIASVNCTHHFELEGSEDYTLENQEKTSSFHKPLLSHYLSPMHNPWTHKFLVAPHIKVVKPTVTLTKTIVLQTIRRETKHHVCYKAPHGLLPPCLPEYKEKYINPTSVTGFPTEKKTEFLGYLEGDELKKEKQHNMQEDIDREQRYLFGIDYFKHTKYVTKTLWVTKVEDTFNTQVTATLLALNCAPSDTNIPPCPEKLEHYIHYDLSHSFKTIRGKNKNALNKGEKESSTENLEEILLEERRKNDNTSDISDIFDEKTEYP